MMSFCVNCYAESYQINYKYKINDTTIDFSYNWLDADLQRNFISFELPKLDVAESYIDFNQPSNQELSKFVIKKIRDDVSKINNSQNDYKIVINDDNTMNVFYNSTTVNKTEVNNLISKIQSSLESLKIEFLKERFFLWNKNDSLITIDYKKISDLYSLKSNTIAIAFKNKNNRYMNDKRYVINNLLSFYQSIPYDTLENDRGDGFSTPFKLLHENKGDCDTKLVAVNSVIKNLFPDIKTIAIVVPNHAFIGIEMPINTNDKRLSYKGRNYVLAETAGPSVAKIGVLSDYSIKNIQSKNFTVIDLN